jgi:hypothetical protein
MHDTGIAGLHERQDQLEYALETPLEGLMTILSHDCHSHQPSMLVLQLPTAEVILDVGDEKWKHELIGELLEDIAKMFLGG